jgi:drug/metabolite transporter (DMT)-like permease
VIGLISAFFSALFNVLNGVFVQTMPSQSITKYEMLGGFITATVFLLATNDLTLETFHLSAMDWMWLAILALVCTTFAFIASIWVMKFVTPFTVSISVNMEPVYTILIALTIDWYFGTTKQIMSEGFYLGASIIILAIFAHAWIKSRKMVADKAL